MIKTSAILLLGLVADALCRRRSAALRHSVLAAALGAAAAVPLVELVAPVMWRLPFSDLAPGRGLEPLALIIPTRIVDLASPAAGAATTVHGSVGVPGLVAALWLAGALVAFAILCVGVARVRWMTSRSRTVSDGRWQAIAAETADRYGIRRPIRLLEQDRQPGLLATWGFSTATVLVPREARTWPEARVRVVLGHELAHVRRHDWLVSMAAECLRAAYWFNPLVWIACDRLRDASEQACDDDVLALGVEGHEYAAHLVDITQLFRRRMPGLPAVPMARPSSLERRVSAMLNAQLNRTPITRRTGMALLLLAAAVTVGVAGIAAQAGPATFSGLLMDAVGRPLPETTLVLSNRSTGQRIETRSDTQGQFAFAGVPAGDYMLEARRTGFATTQGRVTLAAGQALNRDVALQIGAVEESIRVVASAPPPAPSAPGASRPGPPPPPPPAPPRTTRAVPPPPGADRCAQSSIGGCIAPPLKILDVKPIYPAAAREQGLESSVVLEGRIGTDGFVKDLRVVGRSDGDFVNAAVEAISQWQFTATRLDGVPVETNIRITTRFVVQ